MELARAVVICECVSEQLMEIRHVLVSRSMVGGTYWSCGAAVVQLWCGTVLAHGWWR